jgi:hypothetical protein
MQPIVRQKNPSRLTNSSEGAVKGLVWDPSQATPFEDSPNFNPFGGNTTAFYSPTLSVLETKIASR